MQNESMKTEESNLFYNHTFMAGAGLSVRLAGALFGRSLTPGRFFKESYYENRRSTTSEAEEKPQTEFEAVQERILSSAVEKVFGAVRCLREPFQRRVLQRVLDSIEVESPDGQDQTEPSINQQSEDFIAAWLRKQPLMAKLTACMMSTWTYADHGTDKRAQEIFDGYEAEIMVTTMGRVHTIVDGCSFKTWPDIRKGAVETYLGGLMATTMALAAALAGFLAGKGPTDPVFDLRTPKTAQMIQADAAEAGLPLMDDDGRELVFHSLRHTLRTELVRARVSEAVIDHIMRHKAVGVGRRFYTHLTEFEIREAIERLPDYPWPADLQEQQVKKAVS